MTNHPTVRAKFCVTSKTEHEGSTPTHAISLVPVTSGSEENKQFWKYTPTGKIEMQTLNAEAAEAFEVGKEYYVTFTPAS